MISREDLDYRYHTVRIWGYIDGLMLELDFPFSKQEIEEICGEDSRKEGFIWSDLLRIVLI